MSSRPETLRAACLLLCMVSMLCLGGGYWSARRGFLVDVCPLSSDEALLLRNSVHGSRGWLVRVGLDGRTRWSTRLGSEPVGRSQIAISGGVVVVQTGFGETLALEAYALEDGRALWSTPLGSEIARSEALSGGPDGFFLHHITLRSGGHALQVREPSTGEVSVQSRVGESIGSVGASGTTLLFRDLEWFALDLAGEGVVREISGVRGQACLGQGRLWSARSGLLSWVDVGAEVLALESRPLVGGVWTNRTVLSCGWRDGELVLFGYEDYLSRPRLWRVEVGSGRVIYDLALPEDSAHQLIRAQSVALHPLLGELPRHVPLSLRTVGTSDVRLVVVDVDAGAVLWSAHQASLLEIVSVPDGFLIRHEYGGLMSLDGETGRLQGGLAPSLSDLWLEGARGGTLWGYTSSRHSVGSLPWWARDLQTLEPVGGSPVGRTEEDLAAFAAALGVPGAFVGRSRGGGP